MRPGIWRLNSSFVVKKAACGPPNPIGIPNRWLEPTAMSAPNSPGARKSVKASSNNPHKAVSESLIAALGPERMVMPKGSARVWSTARVCGWQSCETKNSFRSSPRARDMAAHMAMASAAAVPSSSSDALARVRTCRLRPACRGCHHPMGRYVAEERDRSIAGNQAEAYSFDSLVIRWFVNGS
ncbi:hypothetical protein B566_EDAN000169 [Ephemera danica]|nr:hypothetical protein B566_EDAN000169 [Ephemera danica]